MNDSYAALRVVSYRWYIVMLWTLTAATQIQAVVVGWQVYEKTRDPLALGYVGLAEALPFITAALYAGHVADRFDRRHVALIAQVVMVATSLTLLLFTQLPHVLEGRVWPIYALLFVGGLARSFFKPASSALSAELVPREMFANAVTWRSSAWQSAAVIGPAIGGLIYGFAGASAAYATDALLMFVSLAAMFAIRRDRRPMPAELEPILKSLTLGLKFVFSQPVIVGAMTLDLFSVLFGGAVALLPVFAAEVLHVGAEGLGMLRAAPAVGSVVMGLTLAHLPPFRRAGRVLLASVALFGICMIAFALSTSFTLSIFLLALSGMADSVSVIIRSTLIQTMTPQQLLGRVGSVNQIFIGSSNEIGAFESGLAARLFGLVPSVVAGGIVTLLVVMVVASLSPRLRQLDTIR